MAYGGYSDNSDDDLYDHQYYDDDYWGSNESDQWYEAEEADLEMDNYDDTPDGKPVWIAFRVYYFEWGKL